MEMTVKNESIAVNEMEVQSVSRSSIVLIGDADVITCSSIFDTPIHSTIRGSETAAQPNQPNRSSMRLGSDFFREAGDSE